jgi:superfamily II DNA helicase RecQ
LRVVPSKDEEADIEFIFDRIKVQPASLVFVATKKEAEEFAASLQALCTTQEFSGDHIAYFHSDLPATAKKRIILAFLEGTIRCVVATQAFGTGINLPCIRLIINRCLCAKIATYLQNIGRGGRDGGPYECILMYSYTMIHDCGKIWCKEKADEWTSFTQMISYPMSSTCRRAHLLPLFDNAFNAESVCDQCDNCILRIADASSHLNVTTATRLMLEVIDECTPHSRPTIQMSRIRDIMLGWKPRNSIYNSSDTQHTKFGCAKKSGFTQDPQIWMLLCTYLIYGTYPALLSETVTSSEHSLSRMVQVTEAGRSFLLDHSAICSIRYPIEFADMPQSRVDLMFNPRSEGDP